VYALPVEPCAFQSRLLNWSWSFALRPAPSCVIAVRMRWSKPASS